MANTGTLRLDSTDICRVSDIQIEITADGTPWKEWHGALLLLSQPKLQPIPKCQLVVDDGRYGDIILDWTPGPQTESQLVTFEGAGELHTR